MKAERVFSILALVLALAALGHSFWVQSQADTRAREALRLREEELVRGVAPRFAEMLEVMSPQEFNAATWNPVTVEDLLRPMGTVISGQPLDVKTNTEVIAPEAPK